jgi:Berberine and berberine like
MTQPMLNGTWRGAHAGSIALDRFTAGVCLNLTGEEPAERIATAFGNENYRRLRAIKHAYDPTNLFRANHNIPPGDQGKAAHLTTRDAHHETK